MKTIKQISIIVILLILIYGVYTLSLPKAVTQIPTIQPPIIKASQDIKIQNNEQPSGDGLVKLTESIKRDSNGDSTYTFKVVDNQTGSIKTIFDSTENSTVSYNIPDNTWSPDDKQFFIRKTVSGNETYLVFKGDGAIYANSNHFLDVGDYWSKTKYTLTMNGITGWASNDLLVLLTTQSNGSAGPSFWFVISSHSFLQLASH